MSESQLLGPIAVLGDFNAHLGLLEGESQNIHGGFVELKSTGFWLHADTCPVFVR